VVAIGELLRRRSFDELILSTLPVGPSEWLRCNVPTRIEQLFNIPVQLVTPPSDLEVDLTAAAGAPAAAPEPSVVAAP
jgi:hypothetical protein